MSEEANPQAAVLPASAETFPALPIATELEVKESGAIIGTNNGVESSEPVEDVATEGAPAKGKDLGNAVDKQTSSDDTAKNKPETTQEDIEMAEDTKPIDTVSAGDEHADEPVDATTGTPASAGKSKGRRKSGVIPEHRNKKLNKKASKAKMTHVDAKPGDYFLIRLKGFPLWPGIVCDETMLPISLLKSRPVTAARPDGTYRVDYEDGGPKVKDRTFPVMYLFTNEFGWVPNFDLIDINLDTIGNVPTTIRKDLYAAHQLAAEKHDLDYYKEVLKNFMEAKQAEQEAKEAAKATKKASKAKRKNKVVIDGQENEDTEMADVIGEEDLDQADPPIKEKKPKKRKVDEDPNTPQRTDSVKKPKTTIKLTTTPKNTNGTATLKSANDQSAAKSTKSKPKKVAAKVKETVEPVAPKEPELSAEEKRVKKEKEILFLRHKLQKGLLTRDQEPREEEMKQMSEFVSKLEGYAELEVSIIRVTKINKVLKAILKLNTIPKEEEFQFKPRSQLLLDKWNKLLASEQDSPPVAPPATTNGADDDAKATPVDDTNGVKESWGEKKVEGKTTTAVTESGVVAKETPKIEDTPALPGDESSKAVGEPTPVESTA